MGDIMNKKLFFTIILISILSIAFIQANPISAFDNGMNVDFDSSDFDSKDVVYEDDDSLYNDFGYYDVDYSTNTNNDPLAHLLYGDTVDIYFDGQSTSVSNNLDSNVSKKLSYEILNFVSKNLNNSTMDVEEIRDGVKSICKKYGSDDCTVNIDSIIGKDQIPIIVWAQGASMLPTIQDGQFVLVNKTQDIHVGDIVSVNSKEYGGIMKRVDKIEGNNVYLVSDNKNVYYQVVDDQVYELKGLCTWVDISEIEGVAIQY